MVAHFILTLLFSLSSWSKDRLGPCHTRSRQMTLIKNCFTGDMNAATDPSLHFFESSPVTAEGVSYCYNSFVWLDATSARGQAIVRVLKDTRKGQVEEYDYPLPASALRSSSSATFAFSDLKGECFNPSGDRSACKTGFLKTIGLKDVNIPMVLSLNKSPHGWTPTNIVSNEKELAALKLQALKTTPSGDVRGFTSRMLNEIHRKLNQLAQSKLVAMQSPAMTPAKLAADSEQFRYCSLALDGFLKERKLPDVLKPEERDKLVRLTDYMNNPSPPMRLPASGKSN